MKCINKKRLLVLITSLGLILSIAVSGCGISFADDKSSVYDIESCIVSAGTNTVANIGEINFTNENVNTDLAKAAALYNLTDGTIMYSKNIHTKLYPASTTKILTAYVALKYGNLSDTVKISERAVDLEPGASRCHFQPGDLPTLEQVLYGFLICSGNDAGVAIAEHISGSVEEFAELMNKEAAAMGAVNSHFCNPHGLHEEEHYTTLDDLRIMFETAIKNEKFRHIIGQKSYTTTVANASGESKEFTWNTTNRYFRGDAINPATVTVLGSKTGTTNEAGSCIVLLTKDNYDKEYISIIMKTSDPGTLYLEMTDLLNTLIKK